MNAYVPTPVSKHEMEHRERQEKKKNVSTDIQKIQKALTAQSIEELFEVHLFIDGN